MNPPMISFVTWNRLGLTMRNLPNLLKTDEDFELFIIDNNSQDGTWNYLETLYDGRIKQKVRFEANIGHVHATNFNLSKRKKGQYFITIDDDVNIHSKNWINEFLNVFSEFPEVGLLGAVTKEKLMAYRLPYVSKQKGDACYYGIFKGYVEGCCQCVRPEVFDILGYWDEKRCIGDVEICYRIINCTPYTAGFIPSIEIDQLQIIDCISCQGYEFCSPGKTGKTCFSIREDNLGMSAQKGLYGSRYRKFIEDTKRGIEAYCTSIYDSSYRNTGKEAGL